MTRVVNEDNLEVSKALALVTEWDCPHEVQNKANQDNIPLVSTTWVVQCLVESNIVPPTSHDKFSFMYSEPEWSWDFRKVFIIREYWRSDSDDTFLVPSDSVWQCSGFVYQKYFYVFLELGDVVS